MAFFDDLGKKLSQAGQTAVQKTKEVADIAKLNSSVYEEEKKINNNYLEIGKLYATLHGEEPGEEFAGMITAIHESEEKIRGYKHQITEIKGIAVCEKCGAEVSLNAAFCSSCGAPMPVEAPAEEVPAEEASEETEEEAAEEVTEEAPVSETEAFGEQ
ncbi:MAG: zinc ribbon domain-containing protein [Roseburia sp.]|nr:zinc ribbon domain-containing protein [Roseburia sp.]MCM1097261.1 zinc ribbon domain-containing protein [Ruminococcus flavefaciens]